MRRRPEYNMKLIGYNLRRLREAMNFSVEEVRQYLRLGSVQAVYKYEKGVSYPPADTMFALMELYGAELRDIIGGHEAKEPVFSGFMEFPDEILIDTMTGRKKGQIIKYCQLYMEYIQRAAG